MRSRPTWPWTRDGAIYVADAWNQRIQMLGPDSGRWPSGPPIGGEHRPLSQAVPGRGRSRPRSTPRTRACTEFVYFSDGQLQATFGNLRPGFNRFGLPNGLAVDPTTGQLLVADADNQRVMLFPSVSAYQ
ncbi:MAG: hypothetical protein R2854_03240 [Caldilineaceae bacterium]